MLRVIGLLGSSTVRGALVCASLLAAAGCSRPPPPSGLEIPRGEAPTGFPSILVSTAGRAPALFAGPDEAAPAFGHLGEGVRVRVEGPIRGQRVPVTVGGGIVVHAWAQVNRLAAFSTRRGRVEGTPVFLGVGDPVSVVGREDDTTYRVVVRPRFGRPDVDDTLVGYAARLGQDWVGEGEASGGIDEGLNSGAYMRLPAGQEVPLYDRPDGNVIARLPPLDPPLTVVVLRARDGWNGVRVGVGPFLVGYVPGELAASDRAALGGRPTRSTSEEMPARIAQETGALFRVAAGTHVMFYGEDVATIRRDAWARELSPRQGEEADVYVAVDDGVAIRGVVPVASLTPVAAADAPQAAAATAQ